MTDIDTALCAYTIGENNIMDGSLSKDFVLKASLEYFNGDELAADVVVGKYLLRNKESRFLEKTPDDMHHRLASEFARMETKFGGPRALSEHAIYKRLERFKQIIPQGSPQYGIGNTQTLSSLSNCVVVASPEDDVSSIVNTGKDLANLFKRRCGVGVDISSLRPDGASVTNSAGSTTGAWSFADFYSYICRMIGQNGRRGALMISMDVRHPDIEKFITMKHDLTKVTGANISIKIRDDFMEAVESDSDFTLCWPIENPDPKYNRVVKAKDIWAKVVSSATKTAEPGILMWDNILNYLPAECYKDHGFHTISTNPCGEIPLSAGDSCRLIAINLTEFVKNPYTEGAYFDFDEFQSCVADGMRLSDDLVELEFEKLDAIIAKVDTEDERILWTKLLTACAQGRRTGLGTLGLGDTMARLRLVYASEQAIDMTDKIYECLKISAYRESVELSKERGSFPVWDWELEKENLFIQSLPEELKAEMSAHGRRNISILTNAPTGSTSIEAQVSSGIEPIFRLAYTRRKKINNSDNSNITPDFIDNLGDKWQHFTVYHHAYNDYLNITGADPNSPPDFFTTSDKIEWEKRIDMQAAIQRHIDHSISSTINLPAGTGDDVTDLLYRRAWKMGLKGVTIYVDGSRSGVLVTEDKAEAKKSVGIDSMKRPDELPCEIHRANIKGEQWIVLVGILDGKPYEIFAGKSADLDIPAKFTTGILIKNARKTMKSRYDLRCGGNDTEILIKDILKWFKNDDYGTFTRLVSMNLRHEVPIHYIVEQMQKDDNDDLWSFNRVLARVLKKYIADGIKRDKACPECGDEAGLTYQEGCLSCSSCGYSKCG